MSSGGNTHWCYQCRRPIRPRSRGMVCPQCNGGFVQELEELGGGYNNPHGYRVRDSSDEVLGIMEALDSLMLRNNLEHRFGLMEALDAFTHQRRRYGMENERNPWLIFQGQFPHRMMPRGDEGRFEMFFNGHPGIGFTRGNNGDFFVGPGLQELIEQLMSERQGAPPPAPRSAIEAMPTVKITRNHLQRDSHCPVCKDRFKLGMEVRQMPCNHIYHSDCIVPWLVQHNSCPVCRHVLGSTVSTPNTGQNPSGRSRNTSSSNSRGRDIGDQTPGRRNPFSFMWPFRSSNSDNNTQEYTENGGSNQATTHGENNHEMNYSGWPFDY